ncbi:MAG: hypothetical protein CMO55_19935 [Verrucomicrobiales bacterium]|nr:hypothetical protein [Verrucomicrobiales bacterium]
MRLPFFLCPLLVAVGMAGYSQENPEPVKAVPVGPPQPAAEKKEEKPAEPEKYVVQSGDNPWLIAKNHGITLGELQKANSIKDPKNLKIGDVLTLPAGVKSKNKPKEMAVAETGNSEKKDESSSESAKPTEGGWEMYTIKAGDNPWKIAKAKGLDHQMIMKLNEGVDFTKLAIGQEIKIPKK